MERRKLLVYRLVGAAYGGLDMLNIQMIFCLSDLF